MEGDTCREKGDRGPIQPSFPARGAVLSTPPRCVAMSSALCWVFSSRLLVEQHLRSTKPSGT